MSELEPGVAKPRMNVESFNLDHRLVSAPYVRVADRKRLPGGDELVKYDVRFTQPNQAHLEMPAVHSIEHLTAELMRNHTDKLIDFSPMGCQTGFYALTLGLEPPQFMQILEATFRDILAAEQVPAANEVQCGWGANHSLEAAQQAVSQFLAQRAVWGQVMAQAAGEPEAASEPEAVGEPEAPAVKAQAQASEAQAPVSETQAAATEPAN
mgnify:FL=1